MSAVLCCDTVMPCSTSATSLAYYLSSSFILFCVQDDSVFSGKNAWTAAEEESLLDAMDMYSFGNW